MAGRRCERKGCRNWAMRGWGLCGPHHDQELRQGQRREEARIRAAEQAARPAQAGATEAECADGKQGGFYARFLTAEERARLARLHAEGALDDEIGLLKVIASRLLERLTEEGDLPPAAELAELRRAIEAIARLERARRALSGEAADGMAGAIGQALDELATQMGWEI